MTDHTEPTEPLWIKRQTPRRAIMVYYKRSRAAAIKANCIDCCGTIAEAKICEVYACPLWMLRPGAVSGVRPPGIPALADLEAQALALRPDLAGKPFSGQKAARNELGEDGGFDDS